MSTRPPEPRAPRAGLDPITTPASALAVVELARSRPPREEIIAFLLDARHVGTGCILDVTGVRDAQEVLDVVDVIGRSVESEASGRHHVGGAPQSIVIASVRREERSPLDDIDLWQQLSDRCDEHGLTLREWFVLTPAGVSCPRELVCEPDRWPR
jgi:hypothetical protein